MREIMKTYRYDSEIADLTLEILNNSNMTIETCNESILVKLFELRGTPLIYKKTIRNIDEDVKRIYPELMETK